MPFRVAFFSPHGALAVTTDGHILTDDEVTSVSISELVAEGVIPELELIPEE